MIVDYSLAAAVTLGLLGLSRLRADPPGEVLIGAVRRSNITMTANGWIQIAIYAVLVTICVKPLGAYMAQVFSNERTFLSPVLGRSSAASTGSAASTKRASSIG